MISAIDVIFNLVYFFVICRVILSWVPHNRKNIIVAIIYNVTEPILYPFRGVTLFSNIGIDFSPIIVILLLSFIKNYLINLVIAF